MQALNVQRESWIQLRKPKPAAEAGQQKEKENEKSRANGRNLGNGRVGALAGPTSERESSFHVSLLAVGRHRN